MSGPAGQQKEMTFWDHLEELRGTLFRSIAAVLLLSVLGFIFKKPLFDFVLGPSKPDFFVYELLGWDITMTLINVDVSAQFFAHLRAAAAAGLVIAVPYILWEIWRFIAPALYSNERKAVNGSFLLASLLFYVGVAVGYLLVLPVCIQFFMNYTVSPEVANNITLNSYMSLFMSTVVLMGVVFEFPVLIIILSSIGVVSRGTLRKGRRYAIVAVLIVSAIITPADPLSMIVVAIPLYLLYEASILCCREGSAQA